MDLDQARAEAEAMLVSRFSEIEKRLRRSAVDCRHMGTPGWGRRVLAEARRQWSCWGPVDSDPGPCKPSSRFTRLGAETPSPRRKHQESRKRMKD
eukprot:5860718-Amphidinium_carterae.1